MSDYSSNSRKVPRDYVLDMIRGIAVLLMIAAHAIDFYHDGSSGILRLVVLFVNTIAFTTFLFLSGTVGYLVYLKNHLSRRSLIKHIYKRLVFFLIAYYLLVFISLYDQMIGKSSRESFTFFFNIISFRTAPSYTEFLIPLIFFSIIIIPFRRLMTKIGENLYLAILASIFFYGLGTFLYHVSVPPYLIPWKALISGHPGLFRFPILQYLPVLIFGLTWGRYLSNYTSIKEKVYTSQLYYLFTFGLLVIAIVIYSILGNSSKEIFLRWPPSISFLLIGIFSVFLLIYFIYKSRELKHHPFFRDTLLLAGQNAFALYWTHIVLLKLYRISGGIAVSSPLIVIGMYLILVITSLAIATFIPFNFAFHLTFIRESAGAPFKSYQQHFVAPIYQIAEDISHKPKIHLRMGYLLLGIILFFVSTSLFTITKEKIFAEPKRVDRWWSLDYSYKRPIDIKNNQSLSIIKAGSNVIFTLDHQSLVKEKKSLPSGNDINIVFFDGHSFQQVPRQVVNKWNNSDTIISFKLIKNLNEKNSTVRYFLYYGNQMPDQPLINKNYDQAPSPAQVSLQNEQAYKNFSRLDRSWYMKDNPDEKAEIIFTTQLSQANQESLVSYQVIGTSLTGYMSPSQLESNTWESTIDPSSLPAGTYRIRAIIKNSKGKVDYSQNCAFNYSYPLYIAWTWDWEGYDVAPSYLRAIERLAQKYQITLTYYFNPRIYTAPDISPARQQYLTDWIKNRRDKFGEEINLHLHMFPDFVKESGVTVKESPRWGFDRNGYDILTTTYNYEEMLKILNRAKQYFEKYDLGSPLAYRAGAWFADETTLEAIQDSGIKADSSARTSYKFGARKLPGFWDVSPTRLPYYPSTTNQNSTNPSPNLSLLEIPNNGVDSYAFSAKDMINRFNMNFDGHALTQKQQVTYLSHPHWFDLAEQKRVDQLFDYISQFNYQSDNGPIIYKTTGQIYQAFK